MCCTGWPNARNIFIIFNATCQFAPGPWRTRSGPNAHALAQQCCVNVAKRAQHHATSKMLPGSEIAPSWSPMRLKIEYWRPEFHNWSPVGDLLLSSEPFANRCLTFYPADVFEIKMKGVFPLTTSITSPTATFFFFFCGFSSNTYCGRKNNDSGKRFKGLVRGM